jgi:Ran GTPase-activating protein (RanGAP) involved in mRNA processing and transport
VGRDRSENHDRSIVWKRKKGACNQHNLVMSVERALEALVEVEREALPGMQPPTCRSVRSWRKVVAGDRHVTELLLSRKGLTAAHCAELGEVVRKSTHLEILDLSHNNLGDEGVAQLSEVLHDCSLQELDLCSVGVHDEGVSKLARSLRGNKNLFSLNLFQNEITDRGAIELTCQLKGNGTLDLLGIDVAGMAPSIYEKLVESLANDEGVGEPARRAESNATRQIAEAYKTAKRESLADMSKIPSPGLHVSEGEVEVHEHRRDPDSGSEGEDGSLPEKSSSELRIIAGPRRGKSISNLFHALLESGVKSNSDLSVLVNLPSTPTRLNPVSASPTAASSPSLRSPSQEQLVLLQSLPTNNGSSAILGDVLPRLNT